MVRDDLHVLGILECCFLKGQLLRLINYAKSVLEKIAYFQDSFIFGDFSGGLGSALTVWAIEGARRALISLKKSADFLHHTQHVLGFLLL